MKHHLLLLFVLFTLNVTIGQHPNPRSGVFLHHSTGNRIWGPNGSSTSIPLEIEKYNDFLNLSEDSCFVVKQKSWPLDPWDNEWYRWHTIFNGEDTNAVIEPILEDYQIVIIKSCYPSSDILDRGAPSDTLNFKRKSIFNYKWHWRNFVKKMGEQPDNYFAIWTNTPRIPSKTDDSRAILSDEFCRWAIDTLAMGLDPTYGTFPSNVYVFDFFHKLAGPDGKMLMEFATAIDDNHPNAAATELVAPQFVEEIMGASLKYEQKSILNSPTLISPIDNSSKISLTPVLEWSAINEAAEYNIQISSSDKFDSIIVDDLVVSSNYLIEEALLKHELEYYWRVYAKDSTRTSEWSEIWNFRTMTEKTDIKNSTNGIPKNYELQQNHPNPFNPSTVINYSLPEKSEVKIQIFNMLGQFVITITDNEEDSGYYKVEWDAKNVPSGVYIYKMVAIGESGTKYTNSKKMLLLK